MALGRWKSFCHKFKNYLIENNHQVINNLEDDNIDLILL